MPGLSTASSRPLLVRFGALGDMTILTVMIRRLYERFGVPVDIVGSGGWTRPVHRTEKLSEVTPAAGAAEAQAKLTVPSSLAPT